MNAINRIITGLIIIFLSILFIIFFGFLSGRGIDYANIVLGSFFLVVGFLILFNKKEDEIEKIKKEK